MIIDKYKYEIDENNAVRIWDLTNPNENDAPFFYQPDYPDGTAWENKSTAEQWAVDTINDWIQSEANYNLED